MESFLLKRMVCRKSNLSMTLEDSSYHINLFFFFLFAVRSGMNIYIRRIFDTCWLAKGVCRGKCEENEFYNILCGTESLCCIRKKDMPTLFVK